VSVVATGMDGASIAAIEPKIERRSLQAEPLRATVTPRAAEPAVVAAVEPELAMQAREEEQPDIFTAPAAEARPVEATVVQPVTRIVDPEAVEAGDLQDEPLFAEPAYEPRRPRGGFLSIFGGRPRYDAPPAPAAPQAAASGARPVPGRRPADGSGPAGRGHRPERGSGDPVFPASSGELSVSGMT
jgi:cell division protein FtsZ